MINENEIMEDLCKIYEKQGFLTGCWENENCQERASENYDEFMREMADKYGVSYSDDLEKYRDYDNDPDRRLKEYRGYYISLDLIKELRGRLIVLSPMLIVNSVGNSVYRHYHRNKEDSIEYSDIYDRVNEYFEDIIGDIVTDVKTSLDNWDENINWV